jgi:long-chain acyl-CoA synthetase
VLRGERLLWRYRELADRVARLAGHLRALGLAAGDRVALLMKNHVSYLEALYAVWWAGLAAVPINAKLHADEVGYILDNAETGADRERRSRRRGRAARAGLRATLVPAAALRGGARRHADRRRAARADRPRVALLHVGTTGGRRA